MNERDFPNPRSGEELPSNLIDLTGLDKAVVLAALYNGSQPQGKGFSHYDPTPMGIEEAQQLLEQTQRFDYLNGRVMKVDLSEDTLDPGLYDRDNGEGAARIFVDSLRKSENPNPDNILIHEQHLTRAEEQAQIARELLDESPGGFQGMAGELAIFETGLSDVVEELEPKIIEAQEKIRKAKEE